MTDTRPRPRMQAAANHIAAITSEEEAFRLIAENIEPSQRYDITADHMELLAWAVSRRVIMDNIESPLWMVDAQADDEDHADLLDTQMAAIF